MRLISFLYTTASGIVGRIANVLQHGDTARCRPLSQRLQDTDANFQLGDLLLLHVDPRPDFRLALLGEPLEAEHITLEHGSSRDNADADDCNGDPVAWGEGQFGTPIRLSAWSAKWRNSSSGMFDMTKLAPTVMTVAHFAPPP